jgi:HPr kinase/phosphorylase
MTEARIHATAVSIDGRGVLIRGAPGSGKSSLALQLIDQGGFGLGDRSQRARLVADDQVDLLRIDHRIRMRVPAVLEGLLEIRGYAIIRTTSVAFADLVLVVDLVPVGQIERLPGDDDRTADILGLKIPRLALPAGDPAAASRLRAVLTTVGAMT